MFISNSCYLVIQKTLEMCGNRCVLFDNMTEDEVKKSEQLKELLSLVKAVVDNNGGKPYSNELFIELKASDHLVDLHFLAKSHKILMMILKFMVPFCH